ncbi:MAG: hypothetical protein ACOYJZ_06625 [Acutalibacter sp.]|jgi:hypothetical protein
MAATNHSTNLGLSLWEQTDRPEWADFLQDNQQLEQLAGGHIANSALHLTAEEKQFLAQRGTVVTYTGSGTGSASVTLPFLPRRITVLAQGKPPMAPREDGGWDVFQEEWLSGEETSYGVGGISVAEDTLTVTLTEGAFAGESGIYHALNRSGITYVVAAEA